MTYYVERVFCRGIIPNGLPAFNYERRELLSKLLCAKDKPRAIIAPSGYGKTALAASYAQMIYSFKNTAWFDCDSPCFLRDLSSGTIKDYLDENQPNIELCVFDDLPHLSGCIVEKFEELVSSFVEKKVEVLILSAPEAKNEYLQTEKYFHLMGNDLLCEKNNIDSIPALQYPTGDPTSLFASTKTFGLYRHELLIYYCAMILQHGTFDDLEIFCDKRFLKKNLKGLSLIIPHVHIDSYKRKFSCVGLNVVDIERGFNFAIDEIIRASRFKEDTKFFEALAKLLIRSGMCERAKDLIMINLRIEERLRWAIDNSTLYSDMHHSHDIVECLAASSYKVGSLRAEMNTCLTHLFFQLKSKQNAIVSATRVLSSRKATNSSKGFAALIACYLSNKDQVDEYEEMMLEYLGVGDKSVYFESPFPSLRFSYDDISLLKDFIVVWNQDAKRGLVYLLQQIEDLNDLHESPYSEEAICFCASHVFYTLLKTASKTKSLNAVFKKIFLSSTDFGNTQEMIGYLIAFCFDCLKKFEDTDVCSTEILDASDQALRVCEDFCSDYVAFANTSCISKINDHRKRLDRSKFYAETTWNRVDSSLPPEVSNIIKPSFDTVKLTFFGGMSIEVDGKKSSCRLAKRTNSVYFLYLLSENLGKELTRDVLVGHIWAENFNKDGNRRNFYNTLTTIKASFKEVTDALVLRKNATGYYLDPEVCATDIDEFQTFCNYLNFNTDKAIRNMTLVAENLKHFSMPLLPQIKKFPRLDALRKSYQVQLVDALVFASVTCLELKEYRSALWFARRAKEIDHNREDAYYLIMKAQSGLNLRSSAVSTFFECKNILDQELGIMPSSEIKDLYQTVIS